MSFRDWLPNPIAGVVACVVIMLVIAAGLSEQKENAECSQHPITQECQDRRGRVLPTSVAPPIVTNESNPAKPTPAYKHWRDYQDLEAQWAQAHWAMIAALVAMIGVVVTTVGVIFVARTLQATRAAVREAERATQAANDAVAVTSDTAKRQLRAYVSTIGAVIGPDRDNSDSFSIVVDIRNTGLTPAYDLICWAEAELDAFPLESRLPIHCIKTESRAVLAPGSSTLLMPTHRLLTTQEQDDLRNDKLALYVFGEAHYKDAFGHQRLTQFRLRMNGQGVRLKTFKADRQGNYAD
jgi:hypothetical protein